MFKNFILVGIGGGLGAMLRYMVYLMFKDNSFPYATLLINIAGSLVIGMVVGYSLKEISFSQPLKLFIAVGICGGFTTFSAFSLENIQLLQSGKYTGVFLYVTISVLAGIAAAWLGIKLLNS
ncbi:MAG: fluoride efflux transporter CrcB [Ferruginibacter sp.]